MFKNHPKGLLAASLANMGERFGFYIMMAILVLFLQAKFGLSDTHAGIIYSIFYCLIYLLALAGGIIADKTRNFKGTIAIGIILMAVGYAMLGVPTPTPVHNKLLMMIVVCSGLFVIAFGNGLFKGNLQALVGQMYDNEKYSKKRDSGFSLFYMFINVGAIFAPFIAPKIREWWLGKHGFLYDAKLPELCHGQLGGTLTPEASAKYVEMAQTAQINSESLLTGNEFANSYLNIFTEGFHYAFLVAIFMMLVSLVIYLVNKKIFPDPAKIASDRSRMAAEEVQMGVAEVRQRMYALFAVFAVVIFFWFSFHQNGLTLTFFARDYTELSLFGYSLSVENFQSINPLCVVMLTPILLGFFGWLRAKGKEPSTPKKIAIGMGIAALAFAVMAIGTYVTGVPDYATAKAAGGSLIKASPFLLIGTYVILTIAELFISPLGISFVSKVSPPKYQGMMQGGWLGATAVGNQLLFIGAILYESIPIWMTWTVFVVACLISMFTMIFMLRWLERVAK